MCAQKYLSYLAFKFVVKVKNKSQNYMRNFGNTRISFVGQVLLLKVLLQLWSFLNHSKPGQSFQGQLYEAGGEVRHFKDKYCTKQRKLISFLVLLSKKLSFLQPDLNNTNMHFMNPCWEQIKSQFGLYVKSMQWVHN